MYSGKTGTPPWIFGFSVDAPTSNWYRDIGFVILERYDDIPRRPNTEKSEKALGISPSWYSYIGRPDDLYGNGIFFFDVAIDWPLSERGVCPFDTGGLWHDRINFDPPLSPAHKLALFNLYDNPLLDWDSLFRKYLVLNYARYANYLEGAIPDKGEGVKEINKIRNQAVAWTWEGRAPKKIFPNHSNVSKFFCSEEKLELLLNEIEKPGTFDLLESEDIIDWLISSTAKCDLLDVVREARNLSETRGY
jgi:hypothetical protein